MGKGTNRWQMSTHGITKVQTVRHHYRLTRISNIQLVIHMLARREQQELSLWLKKIQNGAANSENNWAVSYKTIHHVPSKLHKGTETYVNTKQCACMFIILLFILAKSGQQATTETEVYLHSGISGAR